MPELILHITTRRAWAEAQRRGSYRTESFKHDGFIHFSTPVQVVAVANFLYRGRRDLVLLCVRPENLTAELRYEALGTPAPYPHLYGPLNLSAVAGVVDFPPRADGTFELPTDQLPTDISSSVTP
jgi:uncharacterized protein (DUF952 family)